jgi:hypothetical protein
VRRSALSGAVVATLLMFPLLNALSGAPVWLHWTAFDSVETAVAWAIGAAIVASTIALPAAAGRRLLQDAVCALWLLAGALSLIGAITKIGSLTPYLVSYRHLGGWMVAVGAVLLCALAFGLLRYPGPGNTTRLQRLLPPLWPLSLLLLFHLLRAPGLAASQSEQYAAAPRGAKTALASIPSGVGVGPTGERTVILLFDELSPDYLYGTHASGLAALPALQRMIDQGQVYSGAHLHGGETRIAIPVLFGATPSAPRALVPTLRDEGRSVRVWGWYHDYCSGMAADAQACHANSIYNARTVHHGFSVVDPWWTTLDLLPAEFPFSIVKVPAAIALHRLTLDATRQWLAGQLADPTADIIYAHVNVPHLPLVTTRIATSHGTAPFTMNDEGYRSQFPAVDEVLAEVLDSRTRPTQVIVLSDHNARPLFPKSEHEHIVFMRLRSWAPGKLVSPAPVEAADLLARLSLRPDLP